MGTSSSYPGPTSTPPLLPPWAEEPLPLLPIDVQPPIPPPNADMPTVLLPSLLPAPEKRQPAWSGAKKLAGQLARGGSTAGSVARSYVRASGGARKAAATSVSGRASTSRIGSLFSAALQGGIVQAAALLGITDLIGRDAQFVLATFVDRLAPAGALREEAIARKAVIETLSQVFEQYDVAANGIEALDSMTADGVRSVVVLSIINYVDARFQQELISRVERNALSEQEANQIALQIREYIETNVTIDLGGIDVLALNGVSGQQIIADQYRRAYELLGGGA